MAIKAHFLWMRKLAQLMWSGEVTDYQVLESSAQFHLARKQKTQRVPEEEGAEHMARSWEEAECRKIKS